MADVGKMGWMDLTVPDAESLSDFYCQVIGWTKDPVDMGGYNDFVMMSGGDGVCGICHARGSNANIPPMWIPYFVVANIQVSFDQALLGGATAVLETQPYGDGFYAILRDPAGATFALFQN